MSELCIPLVNLVTVVNLPAGILADLPEEVLLVLELVRSVSAPAGVAVASEVARLLLESAAVLSDVVDGLTLQVAAGPLVARYLLRGDLLLDLLGELLPQVLLGHSLLLYFRHELLPLTALVLQPPHHVVLGLTLLLEVSLQLLDSPTGLGEVALLLLELLVQVVQLLLVVEHLLAQHELL